MYKIGFEVTMNDKTIQAVKAYDLNLPELAVCSIRDEIVRRQSIDTVVEEMNPTTQNNNLRRSLAESRQEIERLKRMGYGQGSAFTLMSRTR